MKALTRRQREVVDFVDVWHRANGYAPTQEEIRAYFGFSSLNAVRSHLNLICKKGFLQVQEGRARAIRVTCPSGCVQDERGEGIPVLGRIAAGVPLFAEENVDELLPTAPSLFGGGEIFAVRVVGESMIQAGIMDGDLAIIRKQHRVENGEIAAVLIDTDATLKRVYRSTDKLTLKAENPAFRALTYHASTGDAPTIMGLYRGVIRRSDYRGGCS